MLLPAPDAPLPGPVVGVTGLNATDNPGPGVAVIRALRSDPAFGGSVVGLAHDVLDPGLYLDGLLDAAFLVPYPSAGRAALLDRLAHVRARVGLDVLLPTLDSELPALLDQEAALAALGVATYLPTRAQHDMRSKARLHDLARAHGLPVPDSVVLTDVDAVYHLHAQLPGPVVVKGVFYGATVCHSVDDAVAAFHAAAAEWGLPVVAQAFVEGEEVSVCAVGDGAGGVVGAVPMKKLLLTRSGKGWAGVTIDDPALLALTAAFMAATRWRGPCELEARRQADGTLFLMEINPRFPAWCDLTSGAGQNQVAAVVALARGEDPRPLPAYTVGTAFVRISLDQIVDISALDALTTRGEVVPHPGAPRP